MESCNPLCAQAAVKRTKLQVTSGARLSCNTKQVLSPNDIDETDSGPPAKTKPESKTPSRVKFYYCVAEQRGVIPERVKVSKILSGRTTPNTIFKIFCVPLREPIGGTGSARTIRSAPLGASSLLETSVLTCPQDFPSSARSIQRFPVTHRSVVFRNSIQWMSQASSTEPPPPSSLKTPLHSSPQRHPLDPTKLPAAVFHTLGLLCFEPALAHLCPSTALTYLASPRSFQPALNPSLWTLSPSRPPLLAPR